MPKTQNNFPTVIWVDGTMKHENFHRLGKTTPMQFWFSSITIYHANSELFTLFPSLIRNDPSIKIFFCESPVNGKNVPVNYWLSSNCNNFYQNLPIFWHGYIRDSMQLCVTFLIFWLRGKNFAYFCNIPQSGPLAEFNYILICTQQWLCKFNLGHKGISRIRAWHGFMNRLNICFPSLYLS